MSEEELIEMNEHQIEEGETNVEQQNEDEQHARNYEHEIENASERMLIELNNEELVEWLRERDISESTVNKVSKDKINGYTLCSLKDKELLQLVNNAYNDYYTLDKYIKLFFDIRINLHLH
jgi:hypothetical protein